MHRLYHLIIYTPVNAADRVREALAQSGAGHIGNYDSCSFSVPGQGRFRPLEGAHPAIGSTDKVEVTEEERIEVVVAEEKLQDVLKAVTKVHPYEEPAMHVIEMRDYHEFL